MPSYGCLSSLTEKGGILHKQIFQKTAFTLFKTDTLQILTLQILRCAFLVKEYLKEKEFDLS